MREPWRPAPAAWAALVALAAAAPAAAGWRDLQQGEPPVLLREQGSIIDAGPPAADASAAVEELPAAAAGDVEPVAGVVSEPTAREPAEPEPGPCLEDAAGCREELDKPRGDPLTSVDIDIRVSGTAGRDYPCECRLQGETFEPRRFTTTTFTWKAAGYCHKPLYFEHWALERYGHSHGFVADSFLSAAHFFGRLPTLPYQMGVQLPWECVYPLGYYRPGSCAPWTVPAVPVSGRGLVVGAAAATGIVFLLP